MITVELYKIAAIAKSIYGKILATESESWRREWQFSFYWVINRIINNAAIDLNWEARHSQWNIDHLFRGQENSLRRNHPALAVVINSITDTGNGIRIDGYLKDAGHIVCDFDFFLHAIAFLPLENVHYHGKRILFNGEGDLIIDALLDLEEVKELVPEPGVERRLNEKISAFLCMLETLREVYSYENITGKNYIETVVGAALFYLPHPVNECFSGYCSINALNEKIKGRRVVKEHIVPRKYAAKKVLAACYESNLFVVDFQERFSRFMYLTPEENRRTVNYAEATHDEALVNLGIEKFPAGESPFVNNHTLFMKFITLCRESILDDQELDIDRAMALLAI